MNRLLAALAVLALAMAAPAGALAKKSSKAKKPSPRAKVLRATLEPVTTDAAYAGISGRAHLVDGKKNDKITIHVKGLRPGQTYPWHIHVAAPGVSDPCAEGAAQGPIVTVFKYRPLTARASGNANSKGTSRSFTRDRTQTYYVNVHSSTTGEPIACGVLKGKSRKAKKKTSSRGGSKVHRGQGRHKGHDKRPAKGKTKA